MYALPSTPKYLRWGACLATVFGLFVVQALVGATPTAHAQGNVTIAPTRVVFEGRERSKELMLLNRGSETVTYRISLIQMSMTKEGKLVRADKPAGGEKFADKMLRFAPRQVHLKPGVAQRVRVMVRKPAELEDDEYRSHMLFQAMPKSAATVDQQVDGGKLALRLNIVSGISIPVIVRHGKLSAKTKIKGLNFRQGKKLDEPDVLEFEMTRKGDKSTYGNLTVKFIPKAEEAEPITLAKLGGVAIYTTHELRKFEIPLKPPEGLDVAEAMKLEDGRIVVTYRERSEDGGALLASEELSLQP